MKVRQKAGLAAGLSLTCALAAWGLGALGALEGLELRTLDFRFRAFAGARKASPDVVIVAIDEKSLREFKRNNVVWKWPRDFYAALVRHIAKGRPKAIAFDLLFSDPDIDRLSSDAAQTDGEFAAAMRGAGNVVLASMLSRENLLGGDNALVAKPFLSVRGSARGETAENAVLPIPLFQRSAKGLGSVRYVEDPEDGVCRRTTLLSYFKGHPFPNLGLAAYLVAAGARELEAGTGGFLGVGGERVPLDKTGRFLITWYGRGGPQGAFRHYSFSDVMASLQLEAKGGKAPIPSSAFRGKIVFVGANASGLFDYRTTPFTGLEQYPGMEIHATVASNLLNRDFLRRVPACVPAAASLLLAALICAAFLWEGQIRWVLAAAAGAGLAYFAAAMALFRWRLLWLDLAVPELALAFAFAAWAAAGYWLEGRERLKLRATFSRYLSPVVISEVIDNKESLDLGGQELVGTAYFSDLKDFTSYSESLAPRELVAFLNEYFSIATDIVMHHKGLLDKYIGDAVMALFGAPIPNSTHAAQACAVALEVQEAVGRAIASGKGRIPPWETRIGINTGPMVVGNMGSAKHVDYTAIGDTVNLASRLEGSNKAYGTRILISASTYRQAGSAFEARELDLLAVKGKKQAVPVYELLGRKGRLSESSLALKRRFEDGLRWYRDRDFAKALSAFEGLRASHPEDGPSRVYVGRCEAFLDSPPPPEWDGSYHMETK